MSMPIARTEWWTGAREAVPSPPPPQPEPTAQPVEYFTAPPPTSSPGPGGVRSLLPADAARNAGPKAPAMAGLEADDPRREVIEQGYQVRDIDRQVNALADQPIDIEGAK